MTETTIPISEITLARLRELARWSNVSLDEALEHFLKPGELLTVDHARLEGSLSGA